MSAIEETANEAPAVEAVPKRAMTLGTGASLVMLALLIIGPMFVKNFIVFQLTMLLIYALAVLALNILTGGSGQFSLGQSAFYAVGAYTSAILMEHMGVNYALTLPVAGIICFGFGFLFGQPALRLSGIYLALATFALAVAMPQLLKLGVFEHWTGGVQGLVVTKPDAPFGLPISQDRWLYYFTLAVSIGIYIASVNLLKSRSGRAFMAIRDNEIAASAMGVDVALYKTLAFGVSAGITGVAGGLGAIAVQFVAPDGYTITLAISLFLGMVVGGVGWLPGSIVGSAFIIFVPNIAEGISKGLSGAVFGVLLFLVIFLVPHGARQVAIVAQQLLGKLKKGRRTYSTQRNTRRTLRPLFLMGGREKVFNVGRRRRRASTTKKDILTPRSGRSKCHSTNCEWDPFGCRRHARRDQQRRARAEEIRYRRDRYRDQDRQHHALQRPASAYGAIGKTEDAYFKKINAEGGINGRKIKFISYDDAYSPPKTVEQARKLVESDEVLVIFNPLGTPPNSAIQKYMNTKKVPQLFVATGATKWNDPKNFPWTMGWQPNYQSEAQIYAKYILKEQAERQDRRALSERRLRQGLPQGPEDGLGDKAASMIVAEASYEVSEPTIDSHIVKLKAPGADMFFNVTTPKFAAQAIKKMDEIGWKPLHFLNNVSASIGSVMKPAGFENARASSPSVYMKDPTDPQWKDDAGMKEFDDSWTSTIRKATGSMPR